MANHYRLVHFAGAHETLSVFRESWGRGPRITVAARQWLLHLDYELCEGEKDRKNDLTSWLANQSEAAADLDVLSRAPLRDVVLP